MQLEICANSYQSAMNAQKAGAHRIELCSELSIGGITPSYQLLKKVMKNLHIPVHVLIRPRGGDFIYSKEEFEMMKENILICKELGSKGIVSGVLHTDNRIDIKRTQELIALCKPLSFTFHRAFDEVPEPMRAIHQLMSMGVDRLLTSGQKNTAIEGLDLIVELQEIAKNKLIVMPGSGINDVNCKTFKIAGFKEIHASASKKITKRISSNFGDSIETVSDFEMIQKILNNIQIP
jgi:copper homeostasis protein